MWASDVRRAAFRLNGQRRVRVHTIHVAFGAVPIAAFVADVLVPDSRGSARAQVAGRDYVENGTGPAATFSVSDPEGSGLAWSLSGDDRDDFSIDAGVLSFITPPNYEAPVDSDTDNIYLVTVELSDGTNTTASDLSIVDNRGSHSFLMRIAMEYVNLDRTARDILSEPLRYSLHHQWTRAVLAMFPAMQS